MVGGILLAVIGSLAYYIEFKKTSKFIFSFWDSLILFAFLSSLMLAVGRSGFGVGQALSSRYTTFTILGIVGLYIKSLGIFSARGKLNKAVQVTLICIIVQGVAVSFVNGVKKGNTTRRLRQTAIRILSEAPSQGDQQLAKFLAPDPQRVRYLAAFLASEKLSVFSRRDVLP
jgi:di/tricarboxylate transporter